MELAFFDLGLHYPGTGLETAYETIATAKFAEKIGYSRYWIGEHHDPDTAWRSPEILMGIIAGSTNVIRIGSAGILIRYHNPLLIAQNFKMLNDLFPQRIDLGFAKGGVNDSIKSYLLGAGEPYNFEENVIKTKSILEERERVRHLLTETAINQLPDLWVLGSSIETVQFAVDNGLNCCLSLCHNLNSQQRLKERLNDYHIYKALSNSANTKIAFLIAGIISDSHSTLNKIRNDSIFTSALKLNIDGATRDAEAYIDNLISLFDPELLVVGNVYRSKRVKFAQMKSFYSIVNAKKSKTENTNFTLT